MFTGGVILCVRLRDKACLRKKETLYRMCLMCACMLSLYYAEFGVFFSRIVVIVCASLMVVLGLRC